MKLEVKLQTLKFCAQLLNSVFLVLGLSVAGCGVWLLFSGGGLLALTPSEELRTVGAGLLLIGGVVIVAAVIGCVGADRENKILLLMFLVVLVVLLLAQLFITLLLLISRDKIGQSVEATVHQLIRDYGGQRDRPEDVLMDSIHQSSSCCGVTGASDWLNNTHLGRLNLSEAEVLPCSCFRFSRPAVNSSWCSELPSFTAPAYGRGNTSYHQGCREPLSDWLQENALTIAGMGGGLLLLQVLQCVVVVTLHRAVGQSAALKRAAILGPAPPDDGEQNFGHDGHHDNHDDK